MFNFDGKFFGFLSKIADLFVLNILFLVCSIPIITIGASTTAMYTVAKKMVANKEGYIVRTFFKSFKENFVKSTIIWLIMLMALAVVVADLLIGNAIPMETLRYMFIGAMLLSIILVVGAMMYALTLQCTFENTLKNTLKNAVLMVFIHFPWTLIIVILTLSPILAVWFLTRYLGVEMLFMITIWFSGVAYINSFIFNRIYKKYM